MEYHSVKFNVRNCGLHNLDVDLERFPEHVVYLESRPHPRGIL